MSELVLLQWYLLSRQFLRLKALEQQLMVRERRGASAERYVFVPQVLW